MKRLFALTLCASLTISCSIGRGNSYHKGRTMTHRAETQARLDEGNQRIQAFKDEMLRQGFREVSVLFSNTREEYILEGNHGRLKNLRLTLRTNKLLEEKEPELSGGIEAYIRDDQAERDFDALYEKVSSVVTGR